MTADEIDAYLAPLEETKRQTLEEVRRRILAIVPGAEQGISYRLPAFRLDGKVVAGFGAFRSHLSYFPHSGAVLTRLSPLISEFETTTGSLHFAIGSPLPEPLIGALIAERIKELGSDRRM